MELWIRSQDKMKLVSNCNLYISTEMKNEYIIEDLNNKYLKLGIYKTKERALEVLDEIQDILKPKMIMESNGGAFVSDDNNLHIINPTYQEIEQLDTIVYEMPNE